MAKPDRWRTDAVRYPFTTTIPTRFGDLDVLGHVNNVAMAAIFEEGRVRFNRSLHLERSSSDVRWLIANVSIAYLGEAFFPDDMIVTAGIGRIGRTSWTILSGAFQRGQCVAVSDTTIVYTDANGSAAIPDTMRAILGRTTMTEPTA